jgi:hypothetical protein
MLFFWLVIYKTLNIHLCYLNAKNFMLILTNDET